jgi:hypothetical protein
VQHFTDPFSLLSQGQYSLARAQQSFKSLVQIHEKNGECVSERRFDLALIFISNFKAGSRHQRRTANALHHDTISQQKNQFFEKENQPRYIFEMKNFNKQQFDE